MLFCGGAPGTLEAVVQILWVHYLHVLDKQGINKVSVLSVSCSCLSRLLKANHIWSGYKSIVGLIFCQESCFLLRTMANIRSLYFWQLLLPDLSFLLGKKSQNQAFFGLSKLKHLVPSFLRLSISAVLLVFTHRMPHVRTWEDMKLSAVLTGTSLQIYNAHMHKAMTDHSNCSVSKYNIVSVEWRLILPIQCQKLHTQNIPIQIKRLEKWLERGRC